MRPLTTSDFKKTLGLGMMLLLLVSVSVWFLTRETLPDTIRIAGGRPGSQHYEVARQIQLRLKAQTGREVELIETMGSIDNKAALESGDADLAVVQFGSITLGTLRILTPLYEDLVFVIRRNSSGISEIRELTNHRIALGVQGSGSRQNSIRLLGYHQILLSEVEDNARYFKEMAKDSDLDGGIVVTGALNADLHALLRNGGYSLLPIKNAGAIALRDPYFHEAVIPRGLFSDGPAIPDRSLDTVATASLLIGREDTPSQVVEYVLKSVFESDLRTIMPVLMTKQEASTWPAPNMHLAARGYFDPFGGLDLVANLMESIAAVKELLFALGALLYLCWSKWRDVAASEKAREISNYKEELDRLLNRTVEIEKAQLDVKDPVELEKYLDQVARIKLEAIDELTHEELRGDRMFHIFLTQCANLIREIQGKIHLYSRERSELQEEPPKGEDESIPV